MSGSNAVTTDRASAARVLVVDDDPTVARAMEVLMSKAGFAPVVCGTGTAALRSANSGDVAGAVVDIHLPDMSGLILSQRLRECLGPTTPIVILSGDNSIDTLRALPDAGATYFFAKPVNSTRLIEQMREWVRTAQESRAR